MKASDHLPLWVMLGACALACIAGMVNVVGYMGFEHQGITHLTGTTTLLGEALSGADWRASLQLAAMILAFVLGAAMSGAIIQDVQLRLGRRYGVALALESILLFAAASLFKQGSMAGPLLAAAACGLQNAMATTYSGALVRTTHLSGLFTDIGINIGHAARGMPRQPYAVVAFDHWRIRHRLRDRCDAIPPPVLRCPLRARHLDGPGGRRLRLLSPLSLQPTCPLTIARHPH